MTAGQHFLNPRPAQLFGETIKLIDTSRYLGGTGYTGDLAAPYLSGYKESCRKDGALLGPLLNRSGLSIRSGVLLYKQPTCPMMD